MTQTALPLNLSDNSRSEFHAELTKLRAPSKAGARELQILVEPE